MKKLTLRSLHRDLGYFYLGLIVAFSLSGIFLNHRNVWHPKRYSFQSDSFTLELPAERAEIDREFVDGRTAEWGLQEQFRGFRVQDDKLVITYDDDRFEVALATGETVRETWRITPILGQMTILHVNTRLSWTLYSGIFGVAMLTIALTGMFIQKHLIGVSCWS